MGQVCPYTCLLMVCLALIPSQALSQEIKGYSQTYKACMVKANGTTFDTISCQQAELDIQDKRLNQHYKALLKNLNAERQEDLKVAQRAWLAFRNANCSFYLDPEGGSMHRVLSSDCVLSHTTTRANELKDMLEIF